MLLGLVMPLSRSASVVSADSLPSPVRELLRSVGVPSLLTGLFQSSSTNSPKLSTADARAAASGAAAIASGASSTSVGSPGAAATANPPRRQHAALRKQNSSGAEAAAVPVPVEFWSYVYQPNRSGILEALGALLRRQGAPSVLQRFQESVDESQVISSRPV